MRFGEGNEGSGELAVLVFDNSPFHSDLGKECQYESRWWKGSRYLLVSSINQRLSDSYAASGSTDLFTLWVSDECAFEHFRSSR